MIDWLGSLPPWLVVLVVALMIFAESGLVIGMVLPGTTAVIAIGVFVGLGVIPPMPAYIAAVVAATAGPSLGWYIGRRSGQSVRTSRLGQFVGEDRWQAAETVIQQRGATAVVFAQFMVIARTLVPLLVGMSGMAYRRFARANIPAAALWALGLTLAGQLAGASYDVVVREMGSAGILLMVTGGVIVGLVWIGRRFSTDPSWEAKLGSSRASRALRTTRAKIESWARALVGERAEPFLSAFVWWNAAILVGVVVTSALVWATNQSPLRRLDRSIASAVGDSAPEWLVDLARGVEAVLDPANVLTVFYVVVGVTLWRRRRSIAPTERARLVIATVGLAAIAVATEVVADLLRRRGSGPDAFEFHKQLAIVPCALALATLITSVGAPQSRKIAGCVVAGSTTVVLAAASMVLGTTLSETIVGVTVAAAWTLMLAPAAHIALPAPHDDT